MLHQKTRLSGTVLLTVSILTMLGACGGPDDAETAVDLDQYYDEPAAGDGSESDSGSVSVRLTVPSGTTEFESDDACFTMDGGSLFQFSGGPSDGSGEPTPLFGSDPYVVLVQSASGALSIQVKEGARIWRVTQSAKENAASQTGKRLAFEGPAKLDGSDEVATVSVNVDCS